MDVGPSLLSVRRHGTLPRRDPVHTTSVFAYMITQDIFLLRVLVV